MTVWCAVAEFGTWVPYFLEEDNVTATVNSDRYNEMLETFLRQKLNMHQDMDNVWFQQDGGNSPHFSTCDGDFEGDVPWSFNLIA